MRARVALSVSAYEYTTRAIGSLHTVRFAGHDLTVGDDEHSVGFLAPSRPRLRERLEFTGRAQAVFERLLAIGRLKDPVGPDATPPTCEFGVA